MRRRRRRMGSREERLPRVTRTRFRRYQQCCARRGWPARGPTWREWARPRLRSLWCVHERHTWRATIIHDSHEDGSTCTQRSGWFPSISRESKSFLKYNGFESVLTSDPPVDVGSTEREVLLRRGVPPGVYELSLIHI